MAKQVRMDDVDRISNLPDAIISHILSFLSTKEAVGTSILSTRWRYRFAFVSNLDFELSYRLLRSRKKRKSLAIKSFENFVNRVLFFHNTTSTEKFRLILCEVVDSSHVNGWLSAALFRGVQHLDLYILEKFTTLPGALFTCRTLVTLKLDIKFVLNVPNYVCFPNLKTLHLASVEFLNDDSVIRLFSSCLSLEDMVMNYCNLTNIRSLNFSHHSLKRLTLVNYSYSPFKLWLLIDAPMLVYLKYRGCQVAQGYTFVNLQSLVSADIDFSSGNPSIPHDAASLFKGIREGQSLHLSSTSLKLLSGCVPFPFFPKMVELKMYTGTHYSMRDYYFRRKGLADLILSSFPKLENLAFNQEFISDLPERVPFCLLFKLKVIEISGFEAGKDCMGKAKYFLKNAGVLEKLTIRMSLSLDEEGKLKMSEELLASPRKSKQVCIVVV